MTLVQNVTHIMQVHGPHRLLPHEWTDVPEQLAATLAGEPEYRVEDAAMVGRFKFIERGVTHLGWASPFYYADGYGSVAQEIARTFLDNPRIRLSIHSRDYDPSHPGFGGYTLDDWEQKAFVPRSIVQRLSEPQERCFYGINMTWPKDVHRHPFCRAIGLTMFETTAPPAVWSVAMNLCRRIAVPCKQNAEAFRRQGVVVPIHVVPLGVEPRNWPIVDRSARDGVFTFLMAGGLTYRKNPEGAGQAFARAFPNERDVRLVLKTRGPNAAEGFRHWARELPRDDRIEVLCEESTPARLQQLMADADAFVFPSRGEGFGLPPLQAMCTGLPTIVSDNSGMSEYCDARYNWPIPCREIPTPPAPGPAAYPAAWGDVGNWWDPDEDALVAAMRAVYEDREAAVRKAAGGAQWVRDCWTVRRTCEAILDVVMTDAREDGLI